MNENMLEPQRLIEEEGSELQRAVLLAGRSASDGGRHFRVLAALGVGTAIAASSKASFAMAATWKKLVLSGAIAFGGAGSVIVYHSMWAPPSEPPPRVSAGLAAEVERVSVHRPASALEAPLPERVEEAPEAEISLKPEEAEPTRTGRAARERGAAGTVRVSEATSALNDELALLDSARGALSGGRPGDALRRLQEHSARFPKGRLGLEAEVLRVQALAASGQREEASRRARRVLDRSPNSVVAARLRRYVIE